MKKMRKVVKEGQRLFGVLVMSALIAGGFKFTCLAEEFIPMNGMGDFLGVEVLEAVLIEELDMSSEIMTYTMLADCTIGVRGASDGRAGRRCGIVI